MLTKTMELQLERKRKIVKDRVPIGSDIDDRDIDKYLLPCEIPRFVYHHLNNCD